MTKILYGKPVADEIYKDLKERIQLGIAKGWDNPPRLTIVTVGDNEASKIYIKKKLEAAEKLGIRALVMNLPDDVSYYRLSALCVLNSKYDDGIIVQLPLPERLSHIDIKTLVPPHVDVDGFHPLSDFKPCTPSGVMKLLEYYDIPVSGKDVCIIGRSDIVGKPLAQMMTDADATVTLCHSKTKNIDFYTQKADIIISAVGKPYMIKHWHCAGDDAEQVIIDVGINRLSNGKVVGDVDIDDILDRGDSILYTPVPGGIGPMTISMLMSNVVKSWEVNNEL